MNKMGVFMTTALVALTISVITTTNVNAATNQSKRLWGNDRYATSSAISKEGWTSTSDYAVIVNGENFPDALSAVSLAKKYNAPLLLTENETLDINTYNELKRLHVKNVLIAGGNSVVNDSVEQSIQSMGISTTRYQGSDRAETSIDVAKVIGTDNGIILTVGNDFTDALSVAPIAAKLQIPIILMPNDNVPDSVANFIKDRNIPKTYILGGSNLISDSVASQFPNVQRIEGDNKFERNINIIKAFSDKIDFRTICFAYSEKFPDALSGAAYAALNGNPIILVGDYVDTTTNDFIKTKLTDSTKINIFGGKAGIKDNELDIITGSSNPANSDLATLIKNADNYFINSDLDNLINTCTEILADDNSNVKAYIYRSYAYAEYSNYQSALSDCNKAIELDSSNSMAYSIRGWVYSETSDSRNSKKDSNTAISLSGDDLLFYYFRANAYFDLQQYDNAIADLNKVIEINPNFAMAYNDMANITKRKGDTNGALALYKKAIEIDPNLSDAYNGIGNIYRNDKDYETAISYYNKEIELNKNSYIGYFRRGTTYTFTKQYNKAIADLEKSIELNPNYAFSHYVLGDAYYFTLENGKAKDEYGLAISLDPNQYIYYRRRGMCYFNYHDTENYIKAIADFSKAIELNPEDIESYEDRGFTYSNNDEYDKAIADFTKVIQNNSNNILMYEARGWAYYKLKEYNEAIDDYSKAIELNPDDFNAYIGRAQCYTSLNQPDKAKTDQAKADELKKNYHN